MELCKTKFRLFAARVEVSFAINPDILGLECRTNFSLARLTSVLQTNFHTDGLYVPKDARCEAE